VVNVLLAANIERAAGLLRISWDQAWHLQTSHHQCCGGRVELKDCNCKKMCLSHALALML